MEENTNNNDIREAYAAQLSSELEKDDVMIKLMQKQLRSSRILSLIMGGILAMLIVLSVIMLPSLLATINQANAAISSINNTIMPQLQEIDVAQFNQAVGTLDQAVGELDIASLNDAVDHLTGAVDGLDIEGLNKAIDNLNTACKPLVNLAKVFGG